VVLLRLLRRLLVGAHSSILDTYISREPCYDFTFHLKFRFEPAIPTYSHLNVPYIYLQTRRALKLGEAVDEAMSLCTDMILEKDYRLNEKDMKCKCFRDTTVIEVISKLQYEHKCTAILCVGRPGSVDPSSVLAVHHVYASNEQQWAEVNAAYAETTRSAE
jgi:hypothetical protein